MLGILNRHATYVLLILLELTWMVSQAQDPDMVSGDSIMLYIPPQSPVLSPIYFHKILEH